MDRLNLPNVEVETFGCKVNTYDSGLIQERLRSKGFLSDDPEFAKSGKVHILNSCAVTSEATSQVLRQARKLKRDDPQSRVIVTGCAAQVDTERFLDATAVDLVVANSHKGDLPDLLGKMLRGEALDRVYKSNIFKKEDLEAGGGEELGHTRSFLKIQDGCDSFCTYCVIPFARGKSRSIEPEALIDKINELQTRGVGEVVLTGVHIGDYRSKEGVGLAELVEDVLKRTSMPRLRLSSLEPVELSDRLLGLFSNPRLCSHFHMSIQSATTSVLERMKRKYTAEQVTESLMRIEEKVPGAFVGMDVIAGFPEESDRDFEETFSRLKDSPWTRLHVFPYSSRPNTYAARAFKGLDGAVIKARAKRLRELSSERHERQAIDQIGRKKSVLWLNHYGLTRDYWPVLLADPMPMKSNEETEVVISGCERQSNPAGDIKLYGRLSGVDTAQKFE